MQILVMYYSRTGNTKKLAEIVATGVGEVEGVECVLKPAAEVTQKDFLSANGIIAGSPNYFGTMASDLKEIFERYVGVRPKMENKVGAAFATGADLSGGKETTIMSIIQAMLIYGMIIVGDPMDATGHYGTACVDEPDDDAAANAVKLGKRVATLVKQLSGA